MLERLHKKGYSKDQIAGTIAFLEGAGYLNDEVLAGDLLRSAIETRFLGERGIREYLSRRGIEGELIDRVMSSRTEEQEETAASAFVARKIKALEACPVPVAKRRLWGMLQRRGFSFEVIRKVVNQDVAEKS